MQPRFSKKEKLKKSKTIFHALQLWYLQSFGKKEGGAQGHFSA